jgi:hypothetical protein
LIFEFLNELKVKENRKIKWKNENLNLKILEYYKRISKNIFVFFTTFSEFL